MNQIHIYDLSTNQCPTITTKNGLEWNSFHTQSKKDARPKIKAKDKDKGKGNLEIETKTKIKRKTNNLATEAAYTGVGILSLPTNT